MFDKLKLPFAIVALAALTGPLAACNTVEGVGKDVEAAGDAIEDSASENKRY